MHKNSEQQLLNPDMVSVANSCNSNDNSKNGKIIYRQMPTPRNLPQKVPPTKIRMQKDQSGSKFLVQTSRLGRGMGVMAAPLTQLTSSIVWM